MIDKLKLLLLVALTLLLSWNVVASNDEAIHTDPIAPVILGVTSILFFALIGRFIARKLSQPSVLGELIMGVAMGNIGYYFGAEFIIILREGAAIFDMVELVLTGEPLAQAATIILGNQNGAQILDILSGPSGPEMIQVAHAVDIFSRYGVIFLLFLVGLETSLSEMRKVGGESSRVAIIGVIMPFLLGFAMARLLMPELSLNTDLFVAATLGATSIGISARVLQDLNQIKSNTANIILGAAVLDDVLGLIMLAVVSSIIVSGGVQIDNLLGIILLAIAFIFSAFYFGPILLRFSIKLIRQFNIVEAKLFVSFLFVMVLAWLANLVGLAPIVGAFAAGVILHDAYFNHWKNEEHHQIRIKDLIAPLEAILVPIFFVLMGIQVKLETFFSLNILILALGLLAAAIVGKIVSGFGAKRSSNRLAIGLGMMPRGEVGLIFAAIGKSLGVLNDELFSAIVLMVIFTTLIAPPLLKYALAKPKHEVDD